MIHQQEAVEIAPAGSESPDRLEDLAQIIRVYNEVTEKLQQSHESLRGEVVRLQRELASTNAQLHRSRRLAALGEMAAGIAHEIRNPLAAIQLFAGMLVEDLRDAGQQITVREPKTMASDLAHSSVTANKIAVAVRGLNAIVTDVLTFSREMNPRQRPISAAEVFQRAIDSHQPAIDAGAVDVVTVDVDAATELCVDAELMHQAMLNLVRNAVDAMAGQSRPAVLTLAARQAEHGAVLTVRDTGPGIADEAIDRIFNPFFTTRSTGNGLGLAIVHRIVDAHGGAISVHNDCGAVFELSLPTSEPTADVPLDLNSGVTA